jgi:hypothetical protein
VKLKRAHLLVLATVPFLLLGAGCSERDPSSLDQARAPIDPLVFDDDFGADVYPQPFSNTYINAVSTDSIYAQSGTRSKKITIPGEGSALGAYSGGVFTSVTGRDFADFNALTLYARSSVNSVLNEAGFGNDNTGFSRFSAGRANIPLDTEWSFIVIPIPDASRLISERGLFTFAEAWEPAHPEGHEIWVDEIRFAQLANISNPRPVMPTVDKQYFTGATVSLSGTHTTFDLDGADIQVNHMPGYFDFAVSDPSVAVVENGEVRVVGVGNAIITASLDTIPAEGSATLETFLSPTQAAPSPTLPAEDVISMFGETYTNVPIESWNPHWTWSTTELAEYSVLGDNTLMYSSLNFVGVVFTAQTINASAMTHLHMDVFAPVGTNFKVKVVLFTDDNGMALDDDELTFDASSTPAFTPGEWSSLDIPLDDFNVLDFWDHVGQLVLSTDDARLVLVDNVYWHR